MQARNNRFQQAFVGEHQQTEQLLSDVKALVSDQRWLSVIPIIRGLSDSLNAHIDVEEKYVYPLVERFADDEELLRTLAYLHKRHLEIPGYLEEIEEAALEHDTVETLAGIELIERVLTDHHRTEESDIFPLFAPEGPLSSSAEQAVNALRGQAQ